MRRSNCGQLPRKVIKPRRDAVPFAVAASGEASDGWVKPGGFEGAQRLRVDGHSAYSRPEVVLVDFMHSNNCPGVRKV
jgi:hypothetical protein